MLTAAGPAHIDPMVVTANLTPHPGTGLGQASRAEFIGRFEAFAGGDAEGGSPPAPGRNTVMPWPAFAGMTEGDLGAVHDSLKTVPPIENRVDRFPDP